MELWYFLDVIDVTSPEALKRFRIMLLVAKLQLYELKKILNTRLLMRSKKC